MIAKKIAFLSTFLIAAPMAANADSITFDFTGIVSGSAGGYGSIATGAPVSGTLTLTLSNADPPDSVGTAGSTTSQWSLGTSSGSSVGRAINPAVVVSTAIQAGSLSYISTTAGNYLEDTFVEGTPSYGFPGKSSQYTVSALNEADPNSETSSEFFLLGRSAPPWSASGLLLASAVSSGDGQISAADSNGQSVLSFSITSVSPATVSLPATAWLMLSGLGGFAALRRRRKTAAA